MPNSDRAEDWVLSALESESTYNPPDWAVANAARIFQLKRPGIVQLAKTMVANLVFDSFDQPLPGGVRHGSLPMRQLLYTAQNVEMDLKLQFLNEETGVVIGQVLVRDDRDLDGVEILLTPSDHPEHRSVTNDLGEFMFEGLPQGSYDLQVRFPDGTLTVPQVPVRKVQ